MFFILSTGRSGTTTIAKSLSSLEGLSCLHEPAPELIREASAYHYGEFPRERLKDILLATRKPAIDGAVYCESNQNLSLIVPLLAEVFPSARYIWLIRNGLDMVASAYHKQWYSGHSANRDRYEDCPPLEKAWIDGRIRGDKCGDMTHDEWANLDRFGRCCWYWSHINRTIESDLIKYAPDNYFFLRLEDMHEQIPSLIEWMGVKVQKLPVINQHNVAKGIPYHWTEWSENDRKTFDYWCGDLMDKFYPSWRKYTDQECDIYYSQHMTLLKNKVKSCSEELNTLKIENARLKSDRSFLLRYPWSIKLKNSFGRLLTFIKK